MPGVYRSAAVSVYRHTQSVASATWTIEHKINTQYAIIDCFIDINSTVAQALPVSVSSTVAGTTIVTWSEPQTGYAIAV